MASKKLPFKTTRSPKAGKPPEDAAVPARVARRRVTAHGAVKKDTMLLEAADGPRILWGRGRRQEKKR